MDVNRKNKTVGNLSIGTKQCYIDINDGLIGNTIELM